MKPFVLVEIDGGCESDTTAVGATDLIGIVVDWDKASEDADYASEMIEEILGRYYPGEAPETTVQAVVDRLRDVVSESEDDYEDVDEDEEFDEDDDLEDEFDDDEEEDDLEDEDEENPHRRNDQGGRETPLASPNLSGGSEQDGLSN